MIWWVLAGTGLLFAMIVFFGAPYLPTHKAQIGLAIKLLNLKKGELLIDLGAGDGRLLAAAAQRGWRVRGYELNPLLSAWCWVRLRRFGDRGRIVWADFFLAKWPADTRGLYIFGTERVMRRLSGKLKTAPRPLRVVSYGFALPGHKPIKQTGGFFVYDLGRHIN